MEEKNITPVTPNSWTNPSIGQSVDNSLKEEVNELKNEVKMLKEEVSRLSGEEVSIPVSPVEETKVEETVEEPKVEENTTSDVVMPFAESPFTESTKETEVEDNVPTEPEETPVENVELNEDMKNILDSVKEEVPVEEEVVDENIPKFDDMLVDEDKEKVSVVVNRYNTDIVATTKGKGAKYITLTEGEHNKLLSGKINE